MYCRVLILLICRDFVKILKHNLVSVSMSPSLKVPILKATDRWFDSQWLYFHFKIFACCHFLTVRQINEMKNEIRQLDQATTEAISPWPQ